MTLELRQKIKLYIVDVKNYPQFTWGGNTYTRQLIKGDRIGQNTKTNTITENFGTPFGYISNRFIMPHPPANHYVVDGAVEVMVRVSSISANYAKVRGRLLKMYSDGKVYYASDYSDDSQNINSGDVPADVNFTIPVSGVSFGLDSRLGLHLEIGGDSNTVSLDSAPTSNYVILPVV
jgi:hypothetical protein